MLARPDPSIPLFIRTPLFVRSKRVFLIRSYRAATPSDLYRHLQAASDRSGKLRRDVLVEDVVESWANQPGYPLITVRRDCRTGALSASQERFYLHRGDAESRGRRIDSEEEAGWWIPLTLITEESNSTFDRINVAAWLEPRANGTTIIGTVGPGSWVIVNVQQVGYYRVNYDENNWKTLAGCLLKAKSMERVHAINRAALLDDAFNLARAGYVDYAIPFDVATYLVRETEYVPWVAAVNSFNFLNRVLATSPRTQRLFQVSDFRFFPPRTSLCDRS